MYFLGRVYFLVKVEEELVYKRFFIFFNNNFKLLGKIFLSINFFLFVNERVGKEFVFKS